MPRRIILAGATGLIGGAAARLLTNAGHDVHCILRRNDSRMPPSVHQIVAQADQWPDLVSDVGAQVAVSCLGTTMRDAGSKQAFAAIDLELVTAFAAAARQAGAEHFIGISSVGANPQSPGFYLATKGKAEAQVTKLGFVRTDFMRPGLLRGNRGGAVRFGEQIGILISPLTDMLLMGSLARYRSISADTVALAIEALVTAYACTNTQGNFIHENEAIEQLAG